MLVFLSRVELLVRPGCVERLVRRAGLVGLLVLAVPDLLVPPAERQVSVWGAAGLLVRPPGAVVGGGNRPYERGWAPVVGFLLALSSMCGPRRALANAVAKSLPETLSMVYMGHESSTFPNKPMMHVSYDVSTCI